MYHFHVYHNIPINVTDVSDALSHHSVTAFYRISFCIKLKTLPAKLNYGVMHCSISYCKLLLSICHE